MDITDKIDRYLNESEIKIYKVDTYNKWRKIVRKMGAQNESPLRMGGADLTVASKDIEEPVPGVKLDEPVEVFLGVWHEEFDKGVYFEYGITKDYLKATENKIIKKLMK